MRKDQAPPVTDLEYVTARLHGRRSRMAEAERLHALCRSPGLSDLARAVAAGAEPGSFARFQRDRADDLRREVEGFLRHASGPGAAFLRWALARFELDDWKLRRRREAGASPDGLHDPGARAVATEALASRPGDARPFLVEAAADRGYLGELLARAARLPAGDRAHVVPLACQEADVFHVQLVARGRFGYGVEAAQLASFHVAGTCVTRRAFEAMLREATLAEAARRLARRAIDAVPPEAADAAMLEALAWQRYRALANRAFRRAPIGWGAVAGYVALRRLEVANLVTVSEGVRLGVPEDEVRRRLVPPG